MKSKYEILTNVLFEHEYLSDGKFNGVVVTPSKDSQRCMAKLGMLFKARESGFTVLFDTLFAGNSRQRNDLLKEDCFLQFSCTLRDQHFYNYTGVLQEDISKSFFYFYNDPKRTLTRGKNVLHTGDFVSENDLVPAVKMNEVFSVKPFALVDLDLNEQLPESNYIRFPARSVYWRYILVSDHLKNLQQPAVMDIATKEVFSGPETLVLPDNREAISFISRLPIALSSSGNKRFQLVENFDAGTGKFKIVLAALPLPDISMVSQVTAAKTGAPDKVSSEIFIY